MAMIKIDAYDYSIYGALKGTVIHLNPDTLSDKNQQGQTSVYYKMNVRINKDQNNPKAKSINIKAGMTSSIDVETGTRTVLTYILKPLIKSFSGALTEK
ncbi:MAG: hypothetical protein EXR35_07070 [Limnohabitans sp.]|nr:hypothetical protein [Limnohabitans sp.]